MGKNLPKGRRSQTLVRNKIRQKRKATKTYRLSGLIQIVVMLMLQIR